MTAWPAGLVEVDTHPGDIAPDWAEHAQGVACARGWWFITQIDAVWRFPHGLDLSRARRDHPAVRRAEIPEPGIDHLGDCDVHDGRLYVAMEGTDPALVGVFDLDLRYLGSAPVAAQGSSNPWCAVDPRTGWLYSSPFDTDHLSVYARGDRGGRFHLGHIGDVALRTETARPLRLERVQGGAFTTHGHLYLTSDRPSGGIIGIDVQTGRRGLQVTVPFEPPGPGAGVLEGIALADLRDAGVPSVAGVVHVLMLARDDHVHDRIWLRHYDIGTRRRGAQEPPDSTERS
jgi:hypothetical protein